MFRGITFDKQQVTDQNDGGFYQHFVRDGIIWGCNITTTNNTVYFSPGEIVVAGRLIWIDGITAVNIDPDRVTSGYARVYLRIDLSKTATIDVFEQIEIDVEYSTTTVFPDFVQGAINTNSGDMIYECGLVRVQIANGQITGIVSRIANAAVNATLVNNKAESALSVASAANATNATTAANATKLGGQVASYYAKATDIPAFLQKGIPAQETMSYSGSTVCKFGNIVFVQLRAQYTAGNGIQTGVTFARLPSGGVVPPVSYYVGAFGYNKERTVCANIQILVDSSDGALKSSYLSGQGPFQMITSNFWYPLTTV